MGPYLFFCSIVVIPCVVYLIYSYTHTNKNNIMDSDKLDILILILNPYFWRKIRFKDEKFR